MLDTYAEWLRRAVPTPSTQATKLSELRRVEAHYGDLDVLYDQDELTSVLEELTYTKEMERAQAPNPSKLDINGDIYNNLASYKSAVTKYVRFRIEMEQESQHPPQTTPDGEEADPGSLAFRYEQDLQTALVACIGQIEPGMVLQDRGKEYAVNSGRIDVLARDAQGGTVVIELKATCAKREVLGQIASYMSDIMAETGKRPRGILIAPEFDDRLIRAARMVAGLTLMRYNFLFTFASVEQDQ